MMKSGVVPTSSIALQIASTSVREPDTELEPGRLATRQLPHPGDELDQLARAWRTPGATRG